MIRWTFAILALILISGCAYSPDMPPEALDSVRDPGPRFPYQADRNRRSRIGSVVFRLKQGMTQVDVRERMGTPDEVEPMLSYVDTMRKNTIVGWSYIYLIAAERSSGTPAERKEDSVHIFFNLNGKVGKVYRYRPGKRRLTVVD